MKNYNNKNTSDTNTTTSQVQATGQHIMKLRTMPYEEYLKTPEWIAKRDEALERDDYRCRVCNSEENLNVHHRTYARRGNEKLNDLTTLCQPCHEHFHKLIDQEYIMMQTYSPPVDLEARKQSAAQKWEEYLIGLLANDINLVPHVVVILNEHDFVTPDAQALFSLLVASYTGAVDANIPPEMTQAYDRCQSNTEDLASLPFDVRVKEAIQMTTRIKKQSLLTENTRLKTLFMEAIKNDDKEAVNDIQQRFVNIQRQLRTLNTATRLQGN